MVFLCALLFDEYLKLVCKNKNLNKVKIVSFRNKEPCSENKKTKKKQPTVKKGIAFPIVLPAWKFFDCVFENVGRLQWLDKVLIRTVCRSTDESFKR
jgi:hypothetical protein